MLEQTKSCKGACRELRSTPDNGACCIDTYRIYDSCRNQECLQDLRILVTEEGQRILDCASAVRVKSVKVLWTRIDTEEMPFNKGYFQIAIRYYFHCVLDCCTGLGTGQDVAGLCVFDKSVLLYGGEGSVSIFRSDILPDSFCPHENHAIRESLSRPRAVVEVAEPVPLRLNVLDSCAAENFGIRVCKASQIPEPVSSCFSGTFSDQNGGEKVCFLSLGLFSMVRIERPAQLVVPACDSCIPTGSGEYDLPYTDPCSLFLSMDFPVKEFYPETTPAPIPGCKEKNEG